MNLVIFVAKMNRYKVSCVCIFSYSFMLIALKLYGCLDHGLKVLFGHNPQIIFLQFYADSFETLQVFRSWSKDLHIVLAYSSDYFCYFFYKMNFQAFQGGTSFVDLLCFCSVLCLLCLCACLFMCALKSPAGKGLTSWLSFVVSNCEFVTFPLVSWARCGT